MNLKHIDVHSLNKKSDIKQLLKVMRITFFLIIAFTFQMMATSTKAQDAIMTLETTSTTVGQLLSEIEKQTDYLVVYSNREVDTSRKINVKNKSDKVSSMLDEVFAETDIDYDFENNYIVLAKRDIDNNSNTNTIAARSMQQGRTITGTVVDNTGETIIGATIVLQGDASKGTVTDYDGNFTLSGVPNTAVFEVSYVGMKTILVDTQGKTSLDIVMEEDNEMLEELVVVGYGVQKKTNLTGSVSEISKDKLTERPITSVSSALQGIVPGLAITSGQGRPGDGSSMRVRGQGTLNNANPYILIDGIESGTINEIDPNDIESISVLKDAASAAIYGSKAANGVILITTKRGATGKPEISYNSTVGWQSATGFIDRMSSEEYANSYNAALADSGKSPRFTQEEIQKFKDGSDPFRYPNTDWNKLGFTGNGFMHKHNVSLSGGNEYTKFMASIGYLNQNGLLKHSNREQISVRSNLDSKISNNLNIRLNLSYIKNDRKDPTNSYVGGGSDQILRQINKVAPWIPYKNEDGTYGTVGDGNPIAWLDLNQTLDRNNQNISSVIALDYDIYKDLKFTAQGSYVSNVEERKEFIKDIQYNSTKYHGPNKLDERMYLWNRMSLDLLLNYNKSINNHNISGLLGYRIEDYNYKYTRAYREGFPNNDLTDLDAGTKASQTNQGYSRKLAMMSYFGRINYDYAGKYLFEANVRADGSSRFSPKNRWGYFPSVSAGWRISEEDFMSSTRDWLYSLKLRGSYGLLGNQDALDDYYPWLVAYNIGTNYPFDNNVFTGIAQTTQKLEQITWEKSENWGVGVDVNVLGLVDFSVEYYNRKTKGIIMDVPVPGSFGLNPYKDNVGSMSNSGIEINASFQKQFGDWRINASGNLSKNKNKILDLGGVNEMISGHTINRVGHSYKSFYGYISDGLFNNQEEADKFTETYGNPFGKPFKAGDLKYKDMNDDGKLTADDRSVLDSELPNYIFGVNLGASWKNFDLSVFMQGAIGVSRYFNTEVFGSFEGDNSHPSRIWLDAWSPDNPSGKIPRITEVSTSSSTPDTYSSFWMQKANYLRIKNIQFGYTLPSSFLAPIGVSKIKIYYSGENLLKFDNLIVNIDPEAPSGRGSHYPQNRTNSIGVNITF